ncbi:MAG: CAP domain-containing protein [Chloroflexi bacterium]|nr:CAP domain-containing protein [Chloroflexota bacterium]
MRLSILHAAAAATLGAASLLSAAGPAAMGATDVGCAIEQSESDIDAIEQELVAELNAYRTERGLGTVEVSPLLTRAAVWKSTARAAGAPETHDDPGRPWDVRLNECGYDFEAAKGENLARLDGAVPAEIEAREIVKAWKASPTHDAVMTDPVFRTIGVARIRTARTSFWTADFGSLTDSEGISAASRANDTAVGGSTTTE